MKKYKIFENRPELSQTEIEKGMDFTKIKMKAASKASLSVSKVLIAGGIGIAAVVVTTAVILLSGPKKETVVTEEIPAVLVNNENPAQQFKIETSKDTTLIFATGSMIKISAGAFVDSTGRPVSGEIDLAYREFHNIGEIILAGIPMRYDSAGKEMHFESAGMFEIRGSKKGSPVFINKEKPLEVAMVSLDSDSTKFNQYYLKNNNWEYTGKDKPVFVKVIDPAKADSTPKKSLKNIVQKFVKPIKKNKNRQQFMIDVNPEVYPELGVFKKVIFEVSTKTKDFDPKKAGQAWYDADIQRMGDNGEYKITFKGTLNGKPEEYEVIGYPVAEEGDYDEAIKKYNSLSQTYEERLNKKNTAGDKKEAKLNSELGRYVDAMNRYRALVKENYELQRQTQESQQLVYRNFQVQNFGIFNSDCPRSMPQGLILAAEFENESGMKLEPATIYLVQKGVNVLYTFYPNRNVSFNPGEENVMFVITKDNTLGWIRRDGLDQIDRSAKKATFKMNTVRKSSYTLADINKILS